MPPESEWDEDEEEEDEEDFRPYYHSDHLHTAKPQKGCLAMVWDTIIDFIVTHIAIALCLGTMVLGGTALVKEIARLGWHGASTVLWDGMMILAYVIVVITVVAVVSYLGKKITRDDKF